MKYKMSDLAALNHSIGDAQYRATLAILLPTILGQANPTGGGIVAEWKLFDPLQQLFHKQNAPSTALGNPNEFLKWLITTAPNGAQDYLDHVFAATTAAATNNTALIGDLNTLTIVMAQLKALGILIPGVIH